MTVLVGWSAVAVVSTAAAQGPVSSSAKVPPVSAGPTLTPAALLGLPPDQPGSVGPLTEPDGSGWARQSTPNVAGASANNLYAVSCDGPQACTAVGLDIDSAGLEVPLAERWNGTKWTVEAIPAPAGALETELNAVSCAAANRCVAVGYAFVTTGIAAVAEIWNGSTWSLAPLAKSNSVAESYFYAVSCPSTTLCVAGGEQQSSSDVNRPLAEILRGTTWTISPTPNPTGSTNATFEAMSCAASASCMAVGASVNPSGDSVAFSELWNGTTWTLEKIPLPSGTVTSYLHGVSCVGPGDCTAVGSFTKQGLAIELSEVWNATAWTITQKANPSGTSASVLLSVSCSAVGACAAIGPVGTATGSLSTAEWWNGTSWTLQSTPDDAKSLLESVSCTAPKACTAVGIDDSTGANTTLAIASAGVSWSIDPTGAPSGAALTTLAAVSCPTAKVCTAVGWSATAAKMGGSTLAERWNGAAWSAQPTPDPEAPSTGDGSVLAGVSCTGSQFCMAVGDSFDSSGNQPLVEAWNGSAWTEQPVVDPTGSTYTDLDAVSCTSATACTAVGTITDAASVTSTLVERWNGTAWAVSPSPNPAGGIDAELLGVSCAGPTTCVAVGTTQIGTNPQQTLAETWNGTTWTMSNSPTPAGTNGSLAAVSCATMTACTAVGSDLDSADTFVTLAEFWNGNSWSIQSTPNPDANTYGSFLDAVSCTAPATCVAGGVFYPPTGPGATLAESLSGTTWSLVTTPNPTAFTGPSTYLFGSYFSAMACPSATSCYAVGYYDNASDQVESLAERTS